MRFFTTVEALNEALGIVGRGVTAKSFALPITSCIHIEAEGETVTFKATNLEVAYTHSFPAMVEEDGGVAVPAQVLIKWASSQEDGNVKFVQKADSKKCQISSGRFKSEFNGWNPEDFPLIPNSQSGNVSDVVAVIHSEDLRALIHRTVFASETKESTASNLTHLGLRCVFDDSDGDSISLSGTDGRRLSLSSEESKITDTEYSNSIIPAAFLKRFVDVLPQDDTAVQIRFSKARSQVLFQFGSTEVVTRLIDGHFPNVESQFPDKFNTTVTAPVKLIAEANKVAGLFSRENSDQVDFHILPLENIMIVKGHAQEYGEVETELPVQVEGSEAYISFNSRYLGDVLASLDSDDAVIEITDATHACVVRPLGKDNHRTILMPLTVLK